MTGGDQVVGVGAVEGGSFGLSIAYLSHWPNHNFQETVLPVYMDHKDLQPLGL